MDINSLYKLAQQGDKETEGQLFEYLLVRFRHFVNQRIRNREDAEEIVQEALTAIFKEYRDMRFEASFAAWAYKVLDNRILTYLKGERLRRERISRTTEAEQTAFPDSSRPGPDLKRKLLECLQKIVSTNLRYARILNLHYHGYRTDEVCKRMNMTATNFYTTLSRARSLLELCLETGRV